VTKNGDVLSNGILFTGRGTHRELIGVDDRIRKNAQEMEKIEVLVKEKVKEKEIIEKEKKNVAKNLEQLNTNFSAASVALREDEFSYEKRLFEKTTVEKRIRKVQKEIKEVDRSLNELKNNMLTNEKLFNKDEEVYSTVEENCTAKESAFKEVEERLRSLRDEQNQDEILLTRLKGEARAKEEVLKSAVKELEGINIKKNENNKRIESFEETIISLEKKSKTLKEKQFNIKEELKEIETTLNKHIERGIAADRGIEELKATEKDVTEKEKSIYEEISQLNLEKVRLESQISSISENIIAEYGVDIASIKEEKTVLDKEKLQEEMDILEERKRKFGPVNLLAEEDLEDTDKRKEELITQKTDLQESQKDLLQTINHIDNVAKERFLDTFMGVRDNFKIVFKKLFETGECDLVLAEGDPLEAEISIIAKPKHKKLERIESLSTGERALVAIALLFSFYLVKPSPICVLDEIDAPLDDANVERFISLLQEFKKRSQLFIITHNKRTMEASDYLYGITMTEPGVSTIASVNIS
jgi:chromosome segregation protein